MHHWQIPLASGPISKAWALLSHGTRRLGCLLLLLAVSVLAGCASTPSSDKSAWLDPQGRRTADLSAIYGIDPITAIAASQHPLTSQALQHIGVKYRYGGTSPDRGFDCSGLIHYSAQESWGLKLPRRARDMASVGQQIKVSELVVGDLVFFNTLGHRYSHVGIYLGDGYFVHAPSSKGQVRVENMSAQYWKARYTGARRIEPVRLANTN
jgi:cell wall-associated NlpC family hydrolase